MVWMSPKAHEALQSELAHLTGPAWDAIVARVAAARDEGDLKENGGYHAAREEHGKLDGRIKQLKALLDSAEPTVVEDDTVVTAGKVVVTEPDFSPNETGRFLLAVQVVDAAYPDHIERISPESPLGSTLLGARQGETLDYAAPNGRVIKIEIVEVSPWVD